MENNKLVGEIIKSEREKTGLSKRELSRLARISDTELTRIEEGIRKKQMIDTKGECSPSSKLSILLT